MAWKSLPTLLVICAMFAGAPTLAQQRTLHWPLADTELDFTSTPVAVTHSYAAHLNRGMGVISDDTGALLMYTDGYRVFNKNHQQMPNGGTLLPSTTSNSLQESIIIPKPGSPTIYYIFSVDQWNGQTTSGLYYSEVDMSAQGGLGDVTATKSVKLIPNTANTLSAVMHANNRDFWLVAHQIHTNQYFVLLVTDQGVSSTIRQQQLGASLSFGGKTKFSPDGQKLATFYSDSYAGIDLFNFDRATGSLSNLVSLKFDDIESSPFIAGLEFSSDGTRLYTSEVRAEHIYQFNVSLADPVQIQKSRYEIPTTVLYNNLYYFQLAPDGKIYITKGGGGGGTAHLGVIDNPNAPGPEVVFHENGLQLTAGDSFVNMLPNFIQSDLFKPSFLYDGHCQGKSIAFRISNSYRVDSVKWNFGEGSTGRGLSTKFSYDHDGTYAVQMVAYYGLVPQTVTLNVKVDPYTAFDLGSSLAVCKGALFSADANFSKYLWNTGDTTSTIHVNQSGLLKLTNTNQLGCSFRDSLIATVTELPVINLPDTINMGTQSNVELNPGTFTSYEWNTGSSAPTLVVTKSAWYSVQVTNAAGCTSAKSVFVKNNSTPAALKPKWKLLNPAPSVAPGNDIFFIDDLTGFIVNGKELLRTTNGGNSWSIQMPMNGSIRIGFKNSIGYIVSTTGSVYKSTHRGGGWNMVASVGASNLNAVTVIHPDTVLVTNDTKLFVTKNGGQSWTSFTVVGSGAAVKHSFFTSSKVGHAVCANGLIRKTTDGGATWRTTLSTNIFPSNFFKVFFVNKDIGYASREFSDVYKTTDGGETWARTGGNFSEAGYGMQFINENVGFVAGEDGGAFKTTNGGATWQWAGPGGLIYGNDLYGIFFVNENQGYTTGLGGRILRTYDGGKHWQEYATTTRTVVQTSFTSQQVGYALAGSDLFKTTDKGGTWNKLAKPATGPETGKFAFANSDVGYAIEAGVLIYKTSDGGATWSKAHASATVSDENLTCIYFINPQLGFASGGYNWRNVFRTTDGGATWTSVKNTVFGKIQFVNDNTGFAFSTGFSHNDVFKTVDAGLSWSIVFGIDDDITSLHFVSELMGYFVGDSGIMYKTSNGGISWQKVTTIPYAYYVDVKRVGDYLFALDDYGLVQLSTNGGTSWSIDLSGYEITRLDVFGNDIYASGGHGTIMTRSVPATTTVTPPPATTPPGDTPSSDTPPANDKPPATTPITGLEPGANESIDVYPNPASRQFIIASEEPLNFSYEIVDLVGQTIQSGESNSNVPVNLDGISPGLYLVRVVNGKKQFTSRLVIE